MLLKQETEEKPAASEMERILSQVFESRRCALQILTKLRYYVKVAHAAVLNWLKHGKHITTVTLNHMCRILDCGVSNIPVSVNNEIRASRRRFVFRLCLLF